MASASAKIRRGTPARAPARRKPAAKKPGLFARMFGAIPVSHETVQRAVTWGTLGLGAALGLAVLQAFGVPAMAGTEVANAFGRAGFEVKRVDLRGIRNMDRLTVYAIAFDQHSMAMPLVDLDGVREKLLRYGWVQDARVSRRLPDTLVVDIVERTPAAVWQYQGRLRLIDASGVVLQDVTAAPSGDLPLLIGADANLHAGELAGLLAKAPALKPVIAGATWIGERRWDLRFQSGETLSLPEGRDESERALVRFARMDSSQNLLGRGFLKFDMRDPTRFVARIDRQVRAIDGSALSPEPTPAAPAATQQHPGLEKVNDTL
ncbi:FtsQ-type POTRA domain-containing protein [Sphingomonas sp. MAH-20]|uniref:Cell division protein FtsQ n=1 Tax=Sphingomonas horti TaxID=2682842 RepID=A0A6I4J2L8_9SPHN|nr:MULTISPECIES: cell division protein FtsQ/DivIB [Sphingomonas]MBA2918644.1 FtsQ-type POTRA domain-containing protein [Sphingomonas sp. CGMCC 1.13658]MVO78675.1 FtsQ-type POTRA domain-containing protein [Sphingomonas horti]